MRTVGIFIALLTALHCFAADQPAATAPAEKAYTLSTDSADLAKNPTEDQIKKAIASIDGDKVAAVYISTDDTHAIQANWEAKNAFSFQYGEGDHQYLTHTRAYSREMAFKLLCSYRNGKDDWRKMVDWEREK